MYNYYEYIVVYRECMEETKHKKKKEKDIPYKKAKESRVIYNPVT
jgi:hypothetical protein